MSEYNFSILDFFVSWVFSVKPNSRSMWKRDVGGPSSEWRREGGPSVLSYSVCILFMYQVLGWQGPLKSYCDSGLTCSNIKADSFSLKHWSIWTSWSLWDFNVKCHKSHVFFFKTINSPVNPKVKSSYWKVFFFTLEHWLEPGSNTFKSGKGQGSSGQAKLLSSFCRIAKVCSFLFSLNKTGCS